METLAQDRIDEIATLAEQYRETGAIVLRNILSDTTLELLRTAFDKSIATGMRGYDTAPDVTSPLSEGGGRFVGNAATGTSAEIRALYQRVLDETPVVDIAAALLGGVDTLWFYGDQSFYKEGKTHPTAWHQDQSYMATEGDDQLQLWISLDPVPQEFSLEMVRGSHHGPIYAPPSDLGPINGPVDDSGTMPPLPDIEANRDRFDIVSFGVEPGDIVVFHVNTLHGGGPTVEGQRRRTIVLKYHGPGTVYQDRKTSLPAEIEAALDLSKPEDRWYKSFGTAHFEDLQPGDPFPSLYPTLHPRVRPLSRS